MSRSRYLFKNVAIFTVGSFGTRFITFLLVPIYTAILNTEQYGVIDLLYTICTVLAPMITLNIGEGIVRFCLDKNADCKRIMRYGFLAVFWGAVIGLAVIPISNLFQISKPYGIYIYLCSLSLGCSQVFLLYLRGRELLLQYSIANIIQSFAVALFNIFLLVVMNMGVKGYFLAYILGNIVTIIYSAYAGKTFTALVSFRINKNELKSIYHFSAALIPNTLMWWIMNASDRIMITWLLGASANGVYTIAYKLPAFVSVCSTIFNQAWSYSAIKENDSEDKEAYSNKVFGKICFLTLLSAGFIIMVLKPLLRVYVSLAYFSAWKYTSILLIGNVFLLLASFLGTTYIVTKNSMGMLKSGVFGAVPNVVLNLLLIPAIGIYGAAVATSFSYFLVFVYRVKNTKRDLYIKILKKEYIIPFVILLGMAFTTYISGWKGQTVLVIEWTVMVFYLRKFVFELLSVAAMQIKKLRITRIK